MLPTKAHFFAITRNKYVIRYSYNSWNIESPAYLFELQIAEIDDLFKSYEPNNYCPRKSFELTFLAAMHPANNNENITTYEMVFMV